MSEALPPQKQIFLAADHRGLELKQALIEQLVAEGYQLVDLGPERPDPDDSYVEYAAKVATAVQANPVGRRGIVICGSGVGVSVVANKCPAVRAGLGLNPQQVVDATAHDHLNVLALAADFVDLAGAVELSQAFLSTPWEERARYTERVAAISEIEKKLCSE